MFGKYAQYQSVVYTEVDLRESVVHLEKCKKKSVFT